MSGPIGPSVWMVSDGRAGNEAQVKAIARALTESRRWLRIGHINGAGHRSDPIRLSPRAPWLWFPPSKWIAPRRSLKQAERETLQPPWPTLWIGAGRRTAAFSAGVKTWSGGKTLVAHILDAGLAEGSVDLSIIPAHDGMTGAGVIETIGAPAYFSPEDIEDAGQAFADLSDEPGKSVVVLLGGDSKTHRFTRGAAETLIMSLNQLAAKNWRVRITTSRRTPIPIRARFRDWADKHGARFWDGTSDGPNPYLGWCLYSDLAIITEDSANMLSEACWFELPIYLARLSGRSDKFDRLHQSFIDHGAARWLGKEPLETWSYPKLREAERVADLIVDELLRQYPLPEMAAADGDVVMPDWL